MLVVDIKELISNEKFKYAAKTLIKLEVSKKNRKIVFEHSDKTYFVSLYAPMYREFIFNIFHRVYLWFGEYPMNVEVYSSAGVCYKENELSEKHELTFKKVSSLKKAALINSYKVNFNRAELSEINEYISFINDAMKESEVDRISGGFLLSKNSLKLRIKDMKDYILLYPKISELIEKDKKLFKRY